MTDYGMMRIRVPISELYFEEPKNDIPSDFKQLWDCHLQGTEVLTKNGFIDLANVSYDDEICTILNIPYKNDINLVVSNKPYSNET
jgi:hypothetical protein